jgi:hypothetical protein
MAAPRTGCVSRYQRRRILQLSPPATLASGAGRVSWRGHCRAAHDRPVRRFTFLPLQERNVGNSQNALFRQRIKQPLIAANPLTVSRGCVLFTLLCAAKTFREEQTP